MQIQLKKMFNNPNQCNGILMYSEFTHRYRDKNIKNIYLHNQERFRNIEQCMCGLIMKALYVK